MGILRPQRGVRSHDPLAPLRIIELPPVGNPGEVDVDPPADQRSETLAGAADQTVEILRPTLSTPAHFVEDQNYRFRDRSRRHLELRFLGQPAPHSCSIVESLEPCPQRVAHFVWNRSQGPSCTADVVDRQAGLRQQQSDLVAESTGSNDRQQVSHRVSVELVEARPGPRDEVDGVAGPERAMKPAPGVVIVIEVGDRSVQGVRLERCHFCQTHAVVALDDRQVVAVLGDHGTGKTTVHGHEFRWQAVGRKRQRPPQTTRRGIVPSGRFPTRARRKDPPRGFCERSSIGRIEGIEPTLTLFDDTARVRERHSGDREMTVEVVRIE